MKNTALTTSRPARSQAAARMALTGFSMTLMLAIANLAITASASASTSPGGRGYELVSPPHKNGADVMADSARTQPAVDGNAVEFGSLTGFGDVRGTGIATDYLAQRSDLAQPGDHGWSVHAITPPQAPMTVFAAFQGFDPRYVGEFSDDLTRGVFRAWSSLTDEPNVAAVRNLYLRRDLRKPGRGTYELITNSATPQAPPDVFTASAGSPRIAATSDDFSRIVFESRLNLAAGATGGGVKTYLWDRGSVSLAGVLPDGTPALCASNGTVCSSAGEGAYTVAYTQLPGVLSRDGSRVTFTAPTSPTSPGSRSGVLYQRIDGEATVQLNVTERTDCAGDVSCGGDGIPDPAPDPAGAQPAQFSWASDDGRRVFFTTAEQLTDDDTNPDIDLYRYDASASDSHLMRISIDQFPGDASGDTQGVVGASDDGRSVYFVTRSLLVPGTPGLAGAPAGIYLWHDGETRLVAPMADLTDLDLIVPTSFNHAGGRYEARVTPDGRHLLFTSGSGVGLLSLRGGVDYDHAGFRQKYVYSADTDELECASCDPSGAAATANVTAAVREGVGAAGSSSHVNQSLSDDGRYVFFHTHAALISDDTNGKTDVYEYDTVGGNLRLVSTGTSTSDSYFLDAGADARDVFFVTRERLVGWDVDTNYDLYDARVGGGFPEPPAPPVVCSGAACRSQAGTAPVDESPASAVSQGTGNVGEPVKRRAKAQRKRCARGFARKRIKGKARARCVRRKTSRSHRGGRSVKRERAK